MCHKSRVSFISSFFLLTMEVFTSQRQFDLSICNTSGFASDVPAIFSHTLEASMLNFAKNMRSLVKVWWLCFKRETMTFCNACNCCGIVFVTTACQCFTFALERLIEIF